MLEFKDVSFTYPKETKKALDSISFQIMESELVVLCGASGCGKTTLLKQIKRNQAPFGSRQGQIFFCSENMDHFTDRELAEKIGFVGQNPDNQIATDKVWHELAFGLESLGVSRDMIRRRVGEMAEYFGITGWFHKAVAELSGGQKQILNLASVMVMQPELLILDEPTSQLDPIGAERFIHTLVKLNQDFGITILLSEQRLEEVLPVADKVMVMDEGQLVGAVPVGECAALLEDAERKKGHPLAVTDGLPAAMKLGMALKTFEKMPLTIREGREWIRKYLQMCGDFEKNKQSTENGTGESEKFRWNGTKDSGTKQNKTRFAEKLFGKKRCGVQNGDAVYAAGLAYSYDKGKGEAADSKEVLSHFGLSVEQGSIYALLGGNGSGKTTALKILAGILRPVRGKVACRGKTAYLPQNPLSLFTEITVEEEMMEQEEWLAAQEGRKPDWEEVEKRADRLLTWLELGNFRQKNPYDLSGGQQQRLALGKILMTEPDILFLDEPTKGMDAAFKKKLSRLLNDLCQEGKTIVLVSHDVEFCAENAKSCGLLFDGQVVSDGPARTFFQSNTFYTTAASRMARGLLEECVLCDDILDRMGVR